MCTSQRAARPRGGLKQTVSGPEHRVPQRRDWWTRRSAEMGPFVTVWHDKSLHKDTWPVCALCHHAGTQLLVILMASMCKCNISFIGQQVFSFCRRFHVIKFKRLLFRKLPPVFQLLNVHLIRIIQTIRRNTDTKRANGILKNRFVIEWDSYMSSIEISKGTGFYK